MRSGAPGWEVSENGTGGTWRVGKATNAGWVKAPGMNWGTPFSCFRMAVPELCGFEGHAIYLDSDMLVLGDIAELWAMKPTIGGIRCLAQNRTDVAVIDCAWFKDRKWWPTIAQMKPSGWRNFEYLSRLLIPHGALEPTLPASWNDCDGQLYNKRPDDVKLIHYTNVLCGQPYRPYDNVAYPKDYPFCTPSYTAGELWWQYYREALTVQFGSETADHMVARAVQPR